MELKIIIGEAEKACVKEIEEEINNMHLPVSRGSLPWGLIGIGSYSLPWGLIEIGSYIWVMIPPDDELGEIMYKVRPWMYSFLEEICGI